MKIVVKCDQIYFSGGKNRKTLTNRHGNLISIRDDTDQFAVWEGKKSRLKEPGKIGLIVLSLADQRLGLG